jgi:hypothetical protein
VQANAVKFDTGNWCAVPAPEEYATLGLGRDVIEGYVANPDRTGDVLDAGLNCNVDGLRLASPATWNQVSADDDVGERNVFGRSIFLAYVAVGEDGDPTVGIHGEAGKGAEVGTFKAYGRRT